MRVLVSGGRKYSDKDTLNRVLDHYHGIEPITCLIQGGAHGADELALNWAKDNSVYSITENANWKLYNRAAGHKRNKEMLEHSPDLILAFPGNKGTADMIKIGKRAGVNVIKIMEKT